jgi:hypothetical protein
MLNKLHSLPNRRTFLMASAVGAGGLAAGSAPATVASVRSRPAKSTILFFLCGGASHIDSWDMKPEASIDYRGIFEPIDTNVPGIQFCEHLPQTAKQAHHMALVHGVTDFGKATGDHHAGYYYNLTGRVPDLTFRTQGNERRPYHDDWPFMGSVVGSQRAPHPSLPQVITLPHKPSKAPYTRPGQFAARLGIEHDPLYLHGDPKTPLQFAAPSLVLDGSITRARMSDRRSLLTALDDTRRNWDENRAIGNHLKQQQKAFDLLTSARATGAFDLAEEPESLRERYGESINGMSLLMARRLVEAGVPFVTVFWKEDVSLNKKCASAGGWDTHANNFNCLQDNLLPEFDRGYSALLEDLNDRGMLQDTLVMVSSEMGRKPKIGDRRSGGVEGAGRDHWTSCQSILLAGGGIRGGQIVGESDRRAEYPLNRPISPADITRTVYHSMGLNTDQAPDVKNLPSDLFGDGSPLLELF